MKLAVMRQIPHTNPLSHSILRDWIKGQITAVETGILTFEGAFLGQIMLPNGRTGLEHATAQELLPKLEGPKT